MRFHVYFAGGVGGCGDGWKRRYLSGCEASASACACAGVIIFDWTITPSRLLTNFNTSYPLTVNWSLEIWLFSSLPIPADPTVIRGVTHSTVALETQVADCAAP